MITQLEHQQRRQRLFAQMANNSIAIIPTSPEYRKSNDQFFPFHADNDFFYLTGFPEPEAVAVLIKDEKHGERYVLFNRIKDEEAEVWVGARIGLDAAKSEFLADEAYPYATLQTHLPQWIQDKSSVYYTLGRYPEFDQQMRLALNEVRRVVRGGIKVPHTFINVESLLLEMRVIKSAAELDLLRKVGDISAEAHIRAMKACRPGRNEYEIKAELFYAFLRKGCEGEAYGSIVGGGKNACVLHYEANNCELKDGEMLLIDAGGRYHGYCADITRTFPVNGKFSSMQRDLYAVVLNAQLAAIETIKVGETWDKMRDAAAYVMTQGLVDLKILKGSVQTLFEQAAYRPFYMHRIGHWLGMDVHDVGHYKFDGAWRPFVEGMVTTVEPGLYFRPGMEGVHKRWHGLGIRIEDDIIVTANGPEIVSEAAPKTIEAIEALMSS